VVVGLLLVAMAAAAVLERVTPDEADLAARQPKQIYGVGE
jgi:hypothetical protein